MRKTPILALTLGVLLMCSGGSFAYSVLTHEEIVDLLWKDEIRPLLLKRFPALTEDHSRSCCASRKRRGICEGCRTGMVAANIDGFDLRGIVRDLTKGTITRRLSIRASHTFHAR